MGKGDLGIRSIAIGEQEVNTCSMALRFEVRSERTSGAVSVWMSCSEEPLESPHERH